MTTARAIITDALTFGLNRLSPGETLDSDLAGVCLNALNNVADELNGGKSFLFREVFTVSSAITGAYGTLGTHWSGLSAGDQILGATVRYGTSEDIPIAKLTMAQYQLIGDKTATGTPEFYAHDGSTTVYLYPVASASVITLRTKQVVSDFADLDTDYTMPKGYKSCLAALLAERMAPSLGALTPFVATQAHAARIRLGAHNANPAILSAQRVMGSRIEQGG